MRSVLGSRSYPKGSSAGLFFHGESMAAAVIAAAAVCSDLSEEDRQLAAR